jgi:hypothetical protein
MPYHVTWAHEKETAFDQDNQRVVEVSSPIGLPNALAILASRAAEVSATRR